MHISKMIARVQVAMEMLNKELAPVGITFRVSEADPCLLTSKETEFALSYGPVMNADYEYGFIVLHLTTEGGVYPDPPDPVEREVCVSEGEQDAVREMIDAIMMPTDEWYDELAMEAEYDLLRGGW